MHAYSVGKPYHPGRIAWPECAEFNYRGGECELRIFLHSPTAREVEAVESGRSEFALFHQPAPGGDQIILCYRFDAAGRPGSGIPWSDAPYTWHRFHPGDPRILPPDPKAFLGRLAVAGKEAWKSGRLPGEEFSLESRALLHVLLIDAATGILRVLRVVTFSPEFTRALFEAIHEQAAQPYDAADYDRSLRVLRRRTSEQLAELADVGCEGGAR